MQERVLANITDAILASFPEGQTYSRANLEDGSIHAGITHFLLSTLDRRGEIEASTLLRVDSEWFDSEDAELQSILHEAVSSLRGTAHFPALEWDRALRKASKNVLDFLIAPVETLMGFIFVSNASSISAIDLQRKSGYFSDYPYLTRGIEAFLTRSGAQRISRSEFENALRQIDEKITSDYEAEAWINLLSPILSLMTVAGLESSGVPVEFAVRFFEQKQQIDISHSIADAAAERGADKITTISLKGIIQSVLDRNSLPPEPEPTLFDEAQHARDDKYPDRRPGVFHPGGDVPSRSTPDGTTKEDSSKPVPLWQKYRMDRSDQSSSGSEADDATPLWMKFEDKRKMPEGPSAETDTRASSMDLPDSLPLADSLPPAEAPRLKVENVVLGIAHERSERYIRDLFGGDTESFSAVMSVLSEAPDWTSASSIIAERVFRPYQVDIYSDIAVDFTNAVEARYSGTST